ARKIEVNLIGFQGDLTGQSLTTDFVERLRETHPFPGVEALVEQLKKDVARARELIGDLPDNVNQDDGSDLKGRLTRFLMEEVAPVLQMDGGNIGLLDIQHGVGRVRIYGVCGGCASAVVPLPLW